MSGRANGREAISSLARMEPPKDAAWQAYRALQDAAIRAEVKRIMAVERHLGGQAMERSAEEAARRYAARGARKRLKAEADGKVADER